MKQLPVIKIILATLLWVSIQSCYFLRKSYPTDEEETSLGVVGESLGPKAGGMDAEALALVYAITTDRSPAAIRPDPDTFVRNLLLEYRVQGSVVAREIGRVESYRLLLGGASQDFTITPQETYDATSLLAKLKVAEEICSGLVAPTEQTHSAWQSILPADPQDSETNIRYLAHRLQGVPTSQVTNDTMSNLTAIINTAESTSGGYTHESYIPVCATLLLDARSMLL